jgi:CHAT domain-containing protein
MGQLYKYIFIAGLFVATFCLYGIATALEVQISPWTITKTTKDKECNACCEASAEFTDLNNYQFKQWIKFDVNTNGQGFLLEKKKNIDPDWLGSSFPNSSPEYKIPGIHFWFDEGPMFLTSATISGEPPEVVYDLRAAGNLTEQLSTARFWKCETYAGSISDENKMQGSYPEDLSVMAIEDGPLLAQGLRTCLESFRNRTPFEDITITATKYTSESKSTPIKEPLERSKSFLEHLKTSNHTDEELDIAFFQYGLAAADALKLKDAKEALSRAIAVSNRGEKISSEAYSALERLVEVLLSLEQLDEAEEVARKLRDPGLWLAAIAVSRGDYNTGGGQFLVELGRILDRKINSFYELQVNTNDILRADKINEISKRVRTALLIWGSAALGHSERVEPNIIYINNPPTYNIAESVFNWPDIRMLSINSPSLKEHRRDLGIAAFLRGEGMRLAGFLQTAETDLKYALFELENIPGGEGFYARAQVSLAALAADQKRELTALDMINKTLDSIKAKLGKDSLPWLEGSVLRSTLLFRIGDKEGALEAAEEGLASAAQSLSDNHSLVIRLKQCKAHALLANNDLQCALNTILSSFGIDKLPSKTEKEWEEYFSCKRPFIEELQNLEKNDLKLHVNPWYINSPDFWENETRLLHSLRDLMCNFIGAQITMHNMPALQKLERIKISTILSKINGSIPGQYVRLLNELISGIEYDEQLLISESMVKNKMENAVTQTSGNEYVQDIRHWSLIGDQSNKAPNEPDEMYNLIRDISLNISYTKAKTHLSLNKIFPGKFRPTLRPGVETDGLDVLLHTSKRAFLSHMDLKQQDIDYHCLLTNIQAASSVEVLPLLLESALLSPGSTQDTLSVKAGKDAARGEAWLRRQRGIVRGMSETAVGKESFDSKRIEIRKRYFSIIQFEPLLQSLFQKAIWGDPNSEQGRNFRDSWKSFFSSPEVLEKGAKTMTPKDYKSNFAYLTPWGGVKYEVNPSCFQDRLNQDEAVLIWLPLERVIHVILVTPKNIRWVEISEGWVKLREHIQRILSAIDKASESVRNGHQVNLAEYPDKDAYELYRILFSQIETDLAGVNHLYTAQLGVTGSIPLGLLMTKPKQGSSLSWLTDRFAITRMPALINPEIFEKPIQKQNLKAPLFLGIGDPILENHELLSATYGPGKNNRYAISSLSSLEELPYATREMKAAARALGVKNDELNKVILSKDNATKELSMKSLINSKHRVLMFATHGLVGGEDIGEPALVLSAPSNGRNIEDDGLLRASDIIGLTINADLVILSACSTSPSGEDGAEPLAGLTSAFLAAGARSIAATHWTIESDATEQVSEKLVSGIYQNQLSPAYAMQEVGKMLRNGGKDHPVYWAPFEILGFPSPHTTGLNIKK